MLCQESIKKPEGFGLVISRHFEKVHRAHLEQEMLLEPEPETGVKQGNNILISRIFYFAIF